MKTAVFIFFTFLPVLVFSQKDFEGIITYKGFQKKSDNYLEGKFYLSKGRIKIETRDFTHEKRTHRSTILDFINGLAYRVDDENQYYTVDSLDKQSPGGRNFLIMDTALAQNIMGYDCRAYIMKPDLNSFMKDVSAITWFSDSIRFTIPEKYRDRNSLASLPDGNMLFLKTVVYMSRDSKDDDDRIDSVYVIALKIDRMSLNDSVFSPPVEYTRMRIEEKVTRPSFLDSVRIDTSGMRQIPGAEKKSAQPKIPSPAKSSLPSKSPAKKGNPPGSIKE